VIERYKGYHELGRLIGKLAAIVHPGTEEPVLDAVLLERHGLRHDLREIRAPVLHVLFDEQGSVWREHARQLQELATSGGGEVVCHAHRTELWLSEQRERLGDFVPLHASPAFAARVTRLH
jgi:hypothetical protein